MYYCTLRKFYKEVQLYTYISLFLYYRICSLCIREIDISKYSVIESISSLLEYLAVFSYKFVLNRFPSTYLIDVSGSICYSIYYFPLEISDFCFFCYWIHPALCRIKARFCIYFSYWIYIFSMGVLGALCCIYCSFHSSVHYNQCINFAFLLFIDSLNALYNMAIANLLKL